VSVLRSPLDVGLVDVCCEVVVDKAEDVLAAEDDVEGDEELAELADEMAVEIEVDGELIESDDVDVCEDEVVEVVVDEWDVAKINPPTPAIMITTIMITAETSREIADCFPGYIVNLETRSIFDI
jgi:hypothetical protein